ncbi:hypothetical protein [Paramuribaculum intestinale]|uniref:hypothetical protein n=3 Tax=Bacteroidales TaxID=171549 RepID=UPI00102533B5|nr:hypothetical protein [Paramuribaculum intestinale]RXE62441.1 hypothetical protein ED375_04810 [Muribaculaceae bacterium Isolate-004 (NCI)]
MIRFSPFNPIYFGSRHGISPMLGYRCVFSDSDHIMLQCFHNVDEKPGDISIVDVETSHTVANISWFQWPIGNHVLSFYELRGLFCGKYRLFIGDDIASCEIIITDDCNILDNTILVQFCQQSNKDRTDIATWINGTQYYIDFRIPGGFLDKDWEFGVDNEQMSTPMYDLIDIHSVDITDKRLTVGFSEGVPVWVGELLNRAFSCDLVYIDGIRYTRVDGERLQKYEAGNGMIFTQMLRQSQSLGVKFEWLNQLALRRIPTHIRRTRDDLRKI